MRKFKIVIEANLDEEIAAGKLNNFRENPEFARLSEEMQDQINVNGFLSGLVEDLGRRSRGNEVVFVPGDELVIGKRTDKDFFAVITTSEETA